MSGHQSHLTGIVIREEEYDTQRDTRPVCTKRKDHGNTKRTWPPASQGEMPQKKPNLLMVRSQTSSQQN